MVRKRTDKRIKFEYSDSDGYWIELHPGYCSEPGLHGIHEDTRKEAHDRMSDVEPCNCWECKADLVQHRGTTITDLEEIVDNALGENL